MKWLLLFCSFISFWIFSDAQTCQLEGVKDEDWNLAHDNVPVDDDERTLFARFTTTAVTGVTIAGGDTIYFEVAFDEENRVLEVRPSALFAQFEQLTASDVAHLIGVDLSFTCITGSRILRFNQPINDVNNHEPTFSSSLYSYNLPMPFPQNIEVTNFGVEIQATDIDITNTRVTFSIEPEGDFTITYGSVVDTLNKVHSARISAARPLRLTQTSFYTLHVTDMGNPQLSTSAQLQIIVDEEASLQQSPSFGKAFYIAEYEAEAANKVDISLDLELHGSAVSSTLISGDHAELFQLIPSSSAINIRLASSLPEEILLESTFIALTVEVTVDNAEYTGRTALIVSIPQPETTTTACPTETTITTTACPEPPTTTECAECICTTTEVTPCPETTTATECVCTTTEITPCPETSTATECLCTTPEVTPCPEVIECTTPEVTPCPETSSTTECICDTTTPVTCEPCECSSTASTQCPETTTSECVCEITPCPETTTTTEYNCPTDTTTTTEICLPCSETTTECPIPDCSMCSTTTTIDCTTPASTITPECPDVCNNTTPTVTDCSECPTTPTPITECPNTSTTDPPITPETTTQTDCSLCPTDCTTQQSTETENTEQTVTVETTLTDCPLVCPTTETTTLTECPSTPTECPLECPMPETTTVTDSSLVCPTPETTTLTDCPLVCPTPETPTVTDCPLVCPTPETTTLTDCPLQCPIPETTTITELPETTTPEIITDCDCTDITSSGTACPTTECPLECPTPTALDCSICTTTTSITTTATPPSAGNLRFEQEVYTFSLSPTHDLHFTFRAIATVEEEIIYDLRNTDGPLPTSLSFDRNTGFLTNNGYLSSGLYQLVITATGQQTEDTATAAVIISVGSAEICDDGSVRTSYAFRLTTIMENTEGIVLSKGAREDIADYNFCIEHHYPQQTGTFYINEETGNVECRAVDREAAIFENMDPAQFTVTLQLNYGPVTQNCPISSTSSIRSVFAANNSNTRATDSRQCVHMDNEIFNEPQKTVLAVVVLDENDNDPIFATNEMIAGYPKSSLSSRISPTQIIQVEATDADIGINAALRYFLDNEDRVTVHPTSGVIYPTNQFYVNEDDFEITAFAQDQNGAGRTSDPLHILIRFLDESHISILTITNVLLEDMDDTLNGIQSSTGIRIKALTASVLPHSEVTRSARADGVTYLRVTGYALDQNDELIATSQLQELLEDVQGLQVQTLPDNNNDNNTSSADEESLTGWIVAVSVLSVLLALIIIAFILAYFFLFRKKKSYSQMEENGSTPSTTPTTTPQFQKNSRLEFTGSKSGVDVSQRRSTGFIFGQTTGEDIGESDTDEAKETRKSVSFNTTVERIDIEREAENDSEVKTGSKQQPLATGVKKNEEPQIEVQRL